MRKQKKTVYAGNKTKTSPPAHQPRDWKFWCMVALTVFWCGLFGVAMVHNAQKTSMPKWWSDQIKAEDTAPPQAKPHPQAKNNRPVPYAKDGDYYRLSFDVLGFFPSNKPDPDNSKTKPAAAQVPAAIQALDGEKISVAGFMIPMVTDKDQASSFILAQTRGSCCYGLVPQLNQWIYVQMGQGKMAEIMMDIPVTVFGTFAVSDRFSSQDRDWCLYRMAGEKVELPKKNWF